MGRRCGVGRRAGVGAWDSSLGVEGAGGWEGGCAWSAGERAPQSWWTTRAGVLSLHFFFLNLGLWPPLWCFWVALVQASEELGLLVYRVQG